MSVPNFIPYNFDPYNFTVGARLAPTGTSTREYAYPQRPRLTFMTADGSTTLATFDAFDPLSSTLPVFDVDFTIGLATTGTLDVLIHDKNNIIDRNTLGLGIKILLECGKFPDEYQKIHNFYVRNAEARRTDTGVFDYHLGCYGSRIRAHERISNFIKSAKVSTFGSSAQVNDPTMQANNLARYLWGSSEHLPLGGPLETFDLSGISDDVTDMLPNINAPLTEFGAIMDMLTTYSGAQWFIDANESIVLRYPDTIDSGLTIKSGDLALDTDDGRLTSYFVGALTFMTSNDIGQGYLNTDFGASQSVNADTSQLKASGSTSLDTLDIATQFSTRSIGMKDLSLLLSKQGLDGVSGTLNGRIVTDLTDLPIGGTIATFTISLDDISSAATAIYKSNLSIVNNAVPVGIKLWIILYKNDLFTNTNTTVQWYNDADVTTPGRFSASRVIPVDAERDQANPDGWVASSTGPQYVYAAFDKSIISIAAVNQQARKRYLPIEGVYSPQWALDAASVSKVMVASLGFSAKPKVTFNAIKCTAPDVIPQFGDTFTLQDGLSGLDVRPVIQSLHMHFDSLGSNAFGTNYIEIQPLTYLDIGLGGL